MCAYYDIDQLILGEETIPIKLCQFSRKTGWLNPEYEKEDLDKGSETEIPLWLGLELIYTEMAELSSLPNLFSQENMKKIESGVEGENNMEINLKSLSNYYFDLGISLVGQLREDDSTSEDLGNELDDLVVNLGDCLKSRYREIVSRTFNSDKTEKDLPGEFFTNVELDLYWAGRNVVLDFEYWESISSDMEKIVLAKRKRNIENSISNKRQKS